MPKLKPGTVMPTAEDEARIQAGIDTDPDAYSLTDAEWAAVKPLARIGRPKAEITKERIAIRLSPDVLERFKAGGPGWQTRIDEALRDWLQTH
jgi:uncharacterized protein (DUF4415 family)